MHLLVIIFSILEVSLFVFAVLAFAAAYRFFRESQKRLRALLPVTAGTKAGFNFRVDRSGFLVPSKKNSVQEEMQKTVFRKPANTELQEVRYQVNELKSMMQQQQHELATALQQIRQPETGELIDDADTGLQKTIENLQLQLQKKETELGKLRQQDALSGRVQQHYTDMQEEFEKMQDKMEEMQQQSWEASDLAIRIDHLEQSQVQLEKNLLKKEEMVRELSTETARLQEMLNETEDKLSEANLQRQQLMRKVQFMEEVNSDMKQMSETNRKLKSELHRVAELESMLHLMTEERNALLFRKTDFR